ncbi:MAG: hypothetical protein QOI77_484, partial [Blastocatellia bacterium]|nr:hypothetical protein [Blastocatellia bacterium]
TINDDYAVSTESGSDRVQCTPRSSFAKRTTRSLPLPVLTSSLNRRTCAEEFVLRCALAASDYKLGGHK